MSSGNVHVQRPEFAKLLPDAGKGHPAAIQMEIGWAFEVASAIEKAIQVGDGESLQQFVHRVTEKLFESANLTIHRRSEYSIDSPTFLENIRVDIFRDPKSPSRGCLQIWIDGKDWAPSAALKLASEYLQKAGFVVLDPDGECGQQQTELRGLEEINSSLMANVLLSILKDAWGVAVKDDIVCHLDQSEYVFDEDGPPELRGCKLTGEQELADCVHQLMSHKANLVSLKLVDQGRKQLAEITRPATGSFCITIEARKMTEQELVEMQAVFTNCSFTPLPTPYFLGNDVKVLSWRGLGDSGSVHSIICKVLELHQKSFKSGDVYAQLHVPFV